MDAQPLTGRSVAVLTACFFTVFVAFSIRYSYGTLLPEMLQPLGITKAQAGVIYSSYFVVNCLFSPLIGILADRCNLRLLIALFVAIMGIGAFLMQYAATLGQASFFFAIAGLGCAACWAPVMAVAQRWTSASKKGLVLSVVDSGSTVGVMTAGAGIPLIVAHQGWQSGWAVLGLATLGAALFNLICIRNRPQQAVATLASAAPAPKQPVSYKALFRNRVFWLIALAYLLNGFAIIIPFTFLSTFAVQELHLPYQTAARLITISGIGGLCSKLVLGPLSDKIGRVGIMVLCAALISGGSLCMPFCTGFYLQLASFAFGIGYGACWAMYAASASDYFPKEAAGGIIGIWSCYLGIGSIMAPIIAGWAADYSGTLSWAFVIAAIGGIGSLLLLLPLFKISKAPST